MVDFETPVDHKEKYGSVDPFEIFTSANNSLCKLRSAQQEVLQDWLDRRLNERDNIIKLHTGSGKTLIGLLMLQSKLNASREPCLYIASTKHLAKQVCEEAEKFNIPFCYLEKGNMGLPNEFDSASKILITYAHMLFNGKTRFGLGGKAMHVNSIVLDDAHACLDVLRDAFTIKITRRENSALYEAVLGLFSEDLDRQRHSRFLDIKNNKGHTLMQVPYWAIQKKFESLLKLVQKHKGSSDSINFGWNLLFDDESNVSCYISEKEINLTPYRFCIDPFRSFSDASTRILMTATTQDDSTFITHMGISANAIINPLTSKSQMWLGEKMIILASEITKGLSDEKLLKFLLSSETDGFGTVSIVPTNLRATTYEENATAIKLQNPDAKGVDKINATVIDEKVEKIIAKNFDNIYVLVNKYEGINLPDETCRLLVLDSIPYFSDLASRHEESCRSDSDYIKKKIAQKIEQGMGRAIRSDKDFCAVLVIGNDLMKFLLSSKSNKYFSEQTQKQIQIAETTVTRAKKEPRKDMNSHIFDLVKQLIRRDSAWINSYNSEMDSVKPQDVDISFCRLVEEEKFIDDLYYQKQYEKAIKKLQNFINTHFTENERERGWFLQKLARYYDSFDSNIAQELQQSAHAKNEELLLPTTKMQYIKKSLDSGRSANIIQYTKEFSSEKELLLHVTECLSNLTRGVDAKLFEKALKELGLLLGYVSTRPDNTNNIGPDNLWTCPNNTYILFECKNEVKVGRNTIAKGETEQISSAINWFRDTYGYNVTLQKYMIISTKTMSYDSSPSEEYRVIRDGKLKTLTKNVESFARLLYKSDGRIADEKDITSYLVANNLLESDFPKLYSEECYKLGK
jgi:replicative superfamily II helicase